ncbi:MAG: hypothetical protein C1943_11370 [Halochromatium sp.]|nr:hypothetical protein [Halochromatium sp.]
MSVQAVNISDNGLGEVGLVPYYTVRNGFDTNVSVVNTSNRYVAAFKIRFREALNSRDARDFNVYLSPNDVWTATISVDPATGIPFIQTADTTCTAPWIGTNPNASFVEIGQTAEGLPIKRMNMTNIAWNGGTLEGNDAGPDGIERAQEGYIEIIEMGVADPNASMLASWAVHGPGQNCSVLANTYNTTAAQAQHIFVTGSGMNCESNTPYLPGQVVTGNEAFRAEFCEPLNILKFSANLIQVTSGVAAELPVTTLANFLNKPDGSENPNLPDGDDISDFPQFQTPNLESVRPARSLQINDGLFVQDDFNGIANNIAVDAVSSLLSSETVINEYEFGGGASGADFRTAWVVTFPTKHHYVDGLLRAPFENTFGVGGSCVTVDYGYYNREELAPATSGAVIPSPAPIQPVNVSVICAETQTLNPGGGNLFDSQRNYEIQLEPGYTSGWIRLGFPQAGSIVGDNGTVYTGLPTIGFSLKTTLGVFGNATPHSFERNVSNVQSCNSCP